MLSAIARVFRTPDLRRKLLFTLSIIAIYRLGVYIPAPGVDYGNVQQCLEMGDTSGGLYQFVNLFSGGALLQVSIFALGIMPYITASIIVQLLRVVIPRFEDLHKEGAAGQATLTQYTRYLTIALGLLQATTLVSLARSGNLFQGCQLPIVPDQSIVHILLMVIVLTAGTGMIMWLGELVTEKGVGNGMSILIFVSIASGFPSSMGSIAATQGWGVFTGVIIIGLCVVALVVFVELSQRRVPVQYAKRMVGRRTVGGSSTYIPIKVNMAGVIPVIFSSSMLALPQMLIQFNMNPDGSLPGWAAWIQANFSGSSPLYMLVYLLLTIFFTYFYVAITFNPIEVSDNMKKYGGFIPGIRAGKPTADYLSYVLSRITFPGAIYLGLIALTPLIAFVLIKADQNFPFGGVSVLIMVGVGLETVKQINAQMQQRHYEGLLR
ncbi:MAG: preprotein translocase subunit SecY [Micrococcaceae bacterium]|uniref:preprotein translocase subunit SecY n=1 Tax=unclassified Arthrobacter TaxID=235627 RepID=UPI00264E9AE0|nr:preprotein translocase subunit SecY [Micrococcaceae bacterium]MDN5813387.1 preprotein translocase subunit SecY [Micrococcaceae bacterium]MDN5824338.1 preprotein translocase subunit SecY [Micrococcaceae bacterium]MDN5879570.1 preprotein translocase subunit SecY [Micrococcaceae bacterium]MDN5886931.1 preprotein translocase subunit SecY [Micrococcaceae bacterium]